MKTTAVRGTKDYLPREMRMRDYVQKVIFETYRSYGYEKISTPILEDIENLEKSDGGENLGLIFKILKRGDKLTKELESKAYDKLCDVGLRYDLTLPLSRYYSNNKASLSYPFKCIQMDRVYRAERPQKGRLREFYQCDIDVIGEASNCAEIELITITARTLQRIGLKNFTVKINDRRILREMILSMGFTEEEIASVCITFDKLDKIQQVGVREELCAKGFQESAINRFMEVLSGKINSLDNMKEFCKDTTLIDDLQKVIQSVEGLSEGTFEIVYEKSLVRGMGYYTGIVFEIVSNDFPYSIAGGGRYDNMIGQFLNEKIPAVGFSIGFERIVSILLENDYKIPSETQKAAVLYNLDDNIVEVFQYADQLREKGIDVSILMKRKKLGKQLQELREEGYDSVYTFRENMEVQNEFINFSSRE